MDSDQERRLIWILGLHHSGTTIFWRAFRRDPRFVCFDEPFTPDISAWFPSNNPKGTLDELIETFGADRSRLRALYEPIQPLDEIGETFSPKQEKYLRFLIGHSGDRVIDETHLHLRLPGLARLTPDAHVIHLYRRASAVVSSHLLPSVGPRVHPVRRALGRIRLGQIRRTFFRRDGGPVSVRRAELVGGNADSKFGRFLSQAGYDAERIMAAPMAVRLLAWWHGFYHRLERQGPLLFGPRFRSVRYEDFASAPRDTMRRLYDWIGRPVPGALDYPDIHPPRPAFRDGDPRWRDAAAAAGFDEAEIEMLL